MKANTLTKKRQSLRDTTSTSDLERIRLLDLFSKEEAAVYLGLSPKTIWTYTRRGLLPSVRLGGLVKYRKRALDETLAKLETRSTARK
ncbi:helix-turn-helix domain-containing protein [Verrucomicrobia bacterium]|jgi:excisionase family DNA binding protein|nr:helix-turn-helix domain-containing protein [Verrucomicrobiota bacterium]